MEATKLQRNNNFTIIGRLTKADVKLGISTITGGGYASVKATIQSVIEGETFEYDVSFYTRQTTSKGEPSKLYLTYADMASMEGKKVEVSGHLRENRYFATKRDQIVSKQELDGRFIRAVRDDEADKANWVLSGFVARTLTEKTNKKGEVYRYDLTLAQANDSGSAISMFVLHVDPSDKNIVSLVSTYEVGQTVQINGPLKFKVETVVVESKYEGGIGGITRTYTNSQRNFFITNCTAAIHDESTYDNMTISELVSDYKARDVESCKKAKSGDASIVAAAPTITKKQTSLI